MQSYNIQMLTNKHIFSINIPISQFQVPLYLFYCSQMSWSECLTKTWRVFAFMQSRHTEAVMTRKNQTSESANKRSKRKCVCLKINMNFIYFSHLHDPNKSVIRRERFVIDLASRWLLLFIIAYSKYLETSRCKRR